MKNVRILDTTLRDGGRLIGCKFSDSQISGITKGLTESNIDIVEMGFLRSNTEYNGNSTIFTELAQFEKFIPKDAGNSMYVAFADYGKEFGMWDFSKITPCTGRGITGFRVGYRKKDLNDAIETFNIVKENGYKLFIQGVESLAYTEDEMLRAVEIINKVHPHSFGIVDTYGAMYKDDVLKIYRLVDENLDKDIAIDFHTHNNMQLSFSFAQEIIEAAGGKREIIIDSTLEGVGKGTGNLNTELIIDYLNRKHSYDYSMDSILDTIDEYVFSMKEYGTWAYQIPYFMAGIYSSHANNIIYLLEKHRVKTKDIKHIISMIEPEKRKRYDYDNIEKLYIEYNSSNVDDREALATLKEKLQGRHILVLAPGKSLETHRDEIQEYIKKSNPLVISVNFEKTDQIKPDIVFYGNQRRYKESSDAMMRVVTSNLKDVDNCLVVNYNKLINRGYKYFDNSSVMLLNLLKNLHAGRITIAGFDGFSSDKNNNFFNDEYTDFTEKKNYEDINREITEMLQDYANTTEDKIIIDFLTPSVFSGIFDSKSNPEDAR